MIRRLNLIISILIFIFQACLAQEDENSFTVDRPGIADLPYTIKPGQYQFETGIDYISRGSFKRLQMPGFQFRTGLSDKAELRLSIKYLMQDSLQDIEAPFGWTNGITPLVIGIKIPFVKEKGIIPEIALLTDLIMPFIGEKTYRPEYTGHDIYLLCNNNFNEHWSLNYNFGSIWEGFSAGTIWTYSFCLSYQPQPKIGLFIEHYAYLPDEFSPEWGADAGITFLVNPTMQLDFSGGVSRILNQDFHFIGTGFSFRLDGKKARKSQNISK